MPERRGIYFAFQGLLMAVLLLLFVYLHQSADGWAFRFWFLTGALTASLGVLRLVDEAVLQSGWFQTAFFIGDALLASLTLHWSGPNPTYFGLYFLVIFGTALTRELRHSLIVTAVIVILYCVSAYPTAAEEAFWIRLNLLLVSGGLMALLSRDHQLARIEHDEHYRERLSRLESLATLGQVAGEVAHRIKGPLTTIRVNSEVLALRSENDEDERTKRELSEIQTAVERCKGILKDLLDLGRIEEIDFSQEDLRDPVQTAVKAVAPHLREKGISPRVSLPEDPMPISADRSLIHEAIANVLQNAADAAGPGGTVTVSAETVERRDSWWPGSPARRLHVVRITDDGVGIERKDLENVFKPFFTARKGEGSGLGLSAALRILEKHRGTIYLRSPGPGRGTVAALELPSA
jgi:signal transduction histidine kinase